MTSDLVTQLGELGLSIKQIAGVMKLMEERETAFTEADENRKAQIRARVQKFRAKNKQETLRNVSHHVETLRNDSREGVTRVEDNLQTKRQAGEEKKVAASPSARPSRGSRIPDNFKPDIDSAVSEGVARQDAERQARSFCDYWRAKPGKDGLKLDWPATWRVWYRRNIPAHQPQQRATAPPETHLGRVNTILDQIVQGKPNDAYAGSTIDGSYERTDRGSASNLVQFDAIATRLRS